MSNAPSNISLPSLKVSKAVGDNMNAFSKILLARISEYKGISGLWVEFEMRLGKYEERRFTPGVSYEEFSRFYTFLEEEYKKLETKTDLTINNAVPNHEGKPVRMTLSGAENIMNYCTTNEVNWDAVSFQKKTALRELDNPLDLDDYDIRLATALEKDLSLEDIRRSSGVSNMDELQHMIQRADKQFRYKQRISFVSHDGLVRYDLTQTKQVYDGRQIRKEKSLSASDLFSQQPTYEVEVELLHNNTLFDRVLPVQQFTDMILYEITNIMQIRSDSELVIPKSIKESVLQDFLRLYLGKKDVAREFDDYYMRQDKQYHKIFPGAKVSTLEMDNLFMANEKRKPCIFSDYTVTDKADGERFILFIDSANTVYLINDRMEVLRTDLVLPAANALSGTMLDGELVVTIDKGVKVYNYYVFDALFSHGERVYAAPLLAAEEHQPSRWDVVQRVVGAINAAVSPTIRGVSFLRVSAKTLRSISGVQPEQMKRECAWIWNHRESFPYELDGLIFTPKFEAYPMGKSWASALKWKPPQENSIDFLVRFQTGPSSFQTITEGDTSTKYQLATLYVGDTKVSERGGREYKEYVEKKFDIPHSMGKDPSYLIRIPVGSTGIKDDVIVRNDTIVECVWNNGWKVLRTRLDKTQRYLASGKKISGTANNMGVAISIWSTIVHPITTDLITGATALDADKKTEYYSKTGTNLTGPVRGFNNYMKALMIGGARQVGAGLIDFSCGRGGDLKKWYSSKYNRVVGLDYSKPGIENMDPAIGAYGRIEQMKKGNAAFSKWANGVKLFWADTSKITTAAHPNGICGESKKGIAQEALADPFDVGVSFFTAHYYFESPMKIRGFFQNLFDNIRTGGIAMITCFDGVEIFKMLENLDVGQPYNGLVDSKVVWSIKKGYNKHTPFLGNSYNVGLKIDIKFESISDEYYTEYLVHPEYFLKIASEYGFELLPDSEASSYFHLDHATGLFGDVLKKFTNEGEMERLKSSELGRIYYKDIEDLVDNDANTDLREWTQNNRYFILRKTGAGESVANGWRSRLAKYDCVTEYDQPEAVVDFSDLPPVAVEVPQEKVVILDQVSAAVEASQVSAPSVAEAAPKKRILKKKSSVEEAAPMTPKEEVPVSSTKEEATIASNAPKKRVLKKKEAVAPVVAEAVATEAPVAAPVSVSTEAVPVEAPKKKIIRKTSAKAPEVVEAAAEPAPKGSKKNAKNSSKNANVLAMLQNTNPVSAKAEAEAAPVPETVSQAAQVVQEAAVGTVITLPKKILHRKKKVEEPK